MQPYQIIAFDLDGTLLNSQKQIVVATKQQINRLLDLGKQVVLVTGRHHTSVYPYYVELGLKTPVICCNGAYQYDFSTHCFLQANALNRQQAQKILQQVQQYHIHTLIYADDCMVYQQIDEHTTRFLQWSQSLPISLRPNLYQVDNLGDFIEKANQIWKFATSGRDLNALQQFATKMQQQKLSAEWSWFDRVDVANFGSSKGASLQQWVLSQGYSMQQVVAFGDNENDLSLLQTAGLGIAMGNSDLQIQQLADCVIGDNDSNAIADKLATLFIDSVESKKTD